MTKLSPTVTTIRLIEAAPRISTRVMPWCLAMVFMRGKSTVGRDDGADLARQLDERPDAPAVFDRVLVNDHDRLAVGHVGAGQVVDPNPHGQRAIVAVRI